MVEKDYFGIKLLQRTYFTTSGTESLKCKGKDVMICPASQAIYSMEVNLLVLILYLQSSKAREVCRRTVFTPPVPEG